MIIFQCMFSGRTVPCDQDPTAIFCNNELDLKDIEVYGFDYDYTLACYTDALHKLIYNLAVHALVKDLKVHCIFFRFVPVIAYSCLPMLL